MSLILSHVGVLKKAKAVPPNKSTKLFSALCEPDTELVFDKKGNFKRMDD